jgi:hypothetical protein
LQICTSYNFCLRKVFLQTNPKICCCFRSLYVEWSIFRCLNSGRPRPYPWILDQPGQYFPDANKHSSLFYCSTSVKKIVYHWQLVVDFINILHVYLRPEQNKLDRPLHAPLLNGIFIKTNLFSTPVTYARKNPYEIVSRYQCYKTFYGRKNEFCKKLVFVLRKTSQTSLMFVSKIGAYPSEAPFRYSTLG